MGNSVGIPLCEWGPCLREAVEVVTHSPGQGVPGTHTWGNILCRPLPLCDAHRLVLTCWHMRYKADPDCKIADTDLDRGHDGN